MSFTVSDIVKILANSHTSEVCQRRQNWERMRVQLAQDFYFSNSSTTFVQFVYAFCLFSVKSSIFSWFLYWTRELLEHEMITMIIKSRQERRLQLLWHYFVGTTTQDGVPGWYENDLFKL